MKPETLGEVHIMFQNLLGEVRELADHVKENTKLTEQVLVQATKTNGRVNIIEPLAMDYQENRARTRGAIALGTIMIGAILTGSFFFLQTYVEKTKQDITDGVVTKLEQKYNIKYTNK